MALGLAFVTLMLAAHVVNAQQHVSAHGSASVSLVRRNINSADFQSARPPLSSELAASNTRWNCISDRGHDVNLQQRLNNTAYSLLYSIAKNNVTRWRELFASDVETRFVLGNGADVGALHGEQATETYMNVTIPSIGEMVDFKTNFRVIFSSVDTTSMTLTWFILWPVHNIQDGFDTALHETLYFEFDCTGEITVYAAWVDTGDAQRANLPPPGQTNMTRLCAGGPSQFIPGHWSSGIQEACTGVNQQFASVASCVTFMESIPRQFLLNGQPQLAYGNSTDCRSWHLGMARSDPATHCPHVGPGGGGKCCNTCVPGEL